MPSTFNNRLRQIILLLVIVLLAILLLNQLFVFLPGFLGAITLYILLRNSFNYLTIRKRWRKTGTAVLFILGSLVIIALPLYFSIRLISSELSILLNNSAELVADARLVGQKIYELTGVQLMTDENILTFQKQAATIIPSLLNSSASILSNFAVMFFLLYFMLVNGREIEKFLDRFIPLKEENIDMLSQETRNMIRANAIGIPVLAIIQGVVATIGYWIFGVKDFALWGFLTGVFSMVPIVGSALIWAPLCIYLFAIDKTGKAIGLLLYAALLISNIDYVVRLTLLRKFMDVHPVITVFGVIVGLGLFGFWGVIFGPLLISYFVILIRIYMNEFGKPAGSSQ
ncbi:MAG TPA: AI-2E family transporter [Ferruginibacter sp.]|jgi:predicted PurR-regulated permease PerM|nr:AI-2E family transporter [Ferruginibacter sp.]HNK28835.1 AI-2E family transporter [Ferruginibacter sp.]HNN71490.1 AI-2E family transporter [Ferruginibacter sp.]